MRGVGERSVSTLTAKEMISHLTDGGNTKTLGQFVSNALVCLVCVSRGRGCLSMTSCCHMEPERGKGTLQTFVT